MISTSWCLYLCVIPPPWVPGGPIICFKSIEEAKGIRIWPNCDYITLHKGPPQQTRKKGIHGSLVAETHEVRNCDWPLGSKMPVAVSQPKVWTLNYMRMREWMNSVNNLNDLGNRFFSPVHLQTTVPLNQHLDCCLWDWSQDAVKPYLDPQEYRIVDVCYLKPLRLLGSNQKLM